MTSLTTYITLPTFTLYFVINPEICNITLFLCHPIFVIILSSFCHHLGANEDAARVARMIIEHLDDIDEIFITLDTHYPLHIAHACSWRRGIAGTVGDVTYAVGDYPLPFTR